MRWSSKVSTAFGCERGTQQCICSVEVLTSNVKDMKTTWVIGWTAALTVGESPSWLCSSAGIRACGQSWGRCASPKHSLRTSCKPRRVWEPISRSKSSTVQCLPYTWRRKQPVSNYPCVAKAVQLLALKLMHLQISLCSVIFCVIQNKYQWFGQLLFDVLGAMSPERAPMASSDVWSVDHERVGIFLGTFTEFRDNATV